MILRQSEKGKNNENNQTKYWMKTQDTCFQDKAHPATVHTQLCGELRIEKVYVNVKFSPTSEETWHEPRESEAKKRTYK